LHHIFGDIELSLWGEIDGLFGIRVMMAHMLIGFGYVANAADKQGRTILDLCAVAGRTGEELAQVATTLHIEAHLDKALSLVSKRPVRSRGQY